MASSLIAALGGLRAHQGWIDIIGNNLANANTPGYKSSRAVFSDLISQRMKAATAPTGQTGGTNPVQVGLGVVLGYTDRNQAQGALNLTGRPLDLAIVGKGYFSLSNGSQTVFSRVGTFGFDGDKNLVDVRTGFQVLDASGQPMQVDLNMVQPPMATREMSFTGNFPAEVEGPLSQVLESSSTMRSGTEATLLGGNTGPFTGLNAGEAYTFEIVANGAAPQTISVTADAGGNIATADIVNEINMNATGLVASDVGGAVQVMSNVTGAASSIKVNPGASNDLAAVMGLSTAQVQGTETLASGATALNSLVSNTADYVDGETIEISGTDSEGGPVAATFVFGAANDGTTVDDLVTFVDGLFTNATAQFDAASGKISLTSDTTGESQLSLRIQDGTNPVGTSNWGLSSFTVTQNGTGPDTVVTSAEVFDQSGLAHVVTFRYERQDDGSWALNAEMNEDEGVVLTPELTGLSFTVDGALATSPGESLTIQFAGQPAQNIDLTFGTIGDIDGMTQFGASASVAIESQNGSAAGQISSISVDKRGTVIGFFTNGETEELAQFGIASFANEGGLESAGDNYFTETPNSGQRTIASGLGGNAGEIVGGALEESNVDTAEEFVRLIQAQRGFQANARIITVQDEMFAEIVRIV